MEYKNTLKLPNTSFAMRAKLAKKEPEILEYWKEIGLYDYVSENRKESEKFMFHDGPPYANGNIHIGTALNKILKDIVIKYKTMRGYDVPYVPGWDTHGLPIEHKVSKELGQKRKSMSKLEIRKECEEYALKFVDIQREDFKRIGVRGDWDHPYLTLHHEYETKVLDVLKDLVKAGNVYKSKKVVHWCPTCETALAEAEIEYADEKSDSIYVKFEKKDEPGTFVIIWTTTPWTLPANMAIALHPKFEYVKVKVNSENWIVAEGLLETLMKKLEITEYEIVEKYTGKDLEGIKTQHPFLDRESPLVLADYVTLETGTGCVHTAPGHGQDDYYTGLKYKLEVFSPVDHQGKYTEEFPQMQGEFVFKANKPIINMLEESGHLVFAETYKHSYPHCWRCKKPIIFRATEQWFISVDENNLREKVLEEIDRVNWVPDWGKNRINAMVKDRPDWCISRQRSWGIPIPSFTCTECGKAVLNEETMNHVIGIVKEEGTNSWFAKDVNELLPENYSCPHCGGKHFEKDEDILDVWIDSGASFEGVLNSRENLTFPADIYLEGSDQHRGWFNSSIFLSVAKHGVAPFKTVITHGFIRDGKGLKMSKSLGNTILPQEISEKYGADILRLWAAASDYRNDINVSINIIMQQTETYKKIRNTIRFLLGNLSDFDPMNDGIEMDELERIDKWALSRLSRLIKAVTEDYDNYEFYKVIQKVNKYIVSDLSAVYLDVVKDRLYVEGPTSKIRRSTQTVLYRILDTLLKVLAPVITFTSEEIYQTLPETLRNYKTVQLENWPEFNSEYISEDIEKEFELLLDTKEKVNLALEKLRNEGGIGHSLDSKVTLKADKSYGEILEKYEGMLPDLFIVSQVILETGDYVELEIEVGHATGEKCERCWKYHDETGKDEEYPNTCPRCAAVLKEYY